MSFILTGAKEKATFNGTKFTCQGAASGAFTTIENALGKAYNKATGLTTSVSDGKVGWFRVQYIDQSYLTHYAVFEGTYADSDKSVTPDLSSIVLSSSGSSLPDFDQDSVPPLYIFGVDPNEAIGVRTLQWPDTQAYTGLVTSSSTTNVAGATSIKITPLSDDSRLKVSLAISGRIARTSSGQGLLGYVVGAYVNSSGTNTATSFEVEVGNALDTADADKAYYFGITINYTLSQSNLNNDGTPVWEILPMLRCGGTNREMEILSASLEALEIL